MSRAGNRYTDSVTTTTRPQLTVGAISAGVIWIGAALESIVYARRSRTRAESIIAREVLANDRPMASLAVLPLPNRRLGIGLTLRR